MNDQNPSETNQTIRIQSPARTCLFGDHQDYMDLPVIACAINRHIELTATPHEKPQLEISLPDIGKEKIIALDEQFEQGVKGDHLLAAYKVFKAQGGSLDKGYKLSIKGNVAINAGISSSSAVLTAWVTFLLIASDTPIRKDKEFIAWITYSAEVTEQQSAGGRMDQYTIALGNIIFLETDDKAQYKTFYKEIPGLIVGESGIPKPTLSLLSELRTKSWEAIRHIQKSHPDFTIDKAKPEDLDALLPLLPDNLRDIFEAAVRNHAITQSALEEFGKEEMDMTKIGALINAHHHMLKDKLHLTVPLIDQMIDAAHAAGALGAKIVGSGLGGSIIALAPVGQEEAVVKAIKAAGARDAYTVVVDPGVQCITPEITL